MRKRRFYRRYQPPYQAVALGLILLVATLAGACSGRGTGRGTPTLSAATATPTETPPVAPTPAERAPPGTAEADVTTPTTYGAPLFVPAPCRFEKPPGKSVTCGYLIVPEERNQAANRDPSRTVRLHVAVVKSTGDAPAPDPLLYLAGGPGDHALEHLPWIAQNFDSVLEQRDLVVFDQRGVGLSEPALDCPEVADFVLEILDRNLSREEELREGVQAFRACRDRWVRAGVDLSVYTSAANAADVNDLRLALGYAEWNLYGVSYGTRLALTVMRDYPAGLRSVILDSVYLPQVDSLVERAVNAERAFNLLFQRCAADAACNAAFPDLEKVFYDLVAGWDAEPVMVRVDSHDVSLNGDDLIGIVHEMLYDSNIIPGLPKLIFQAREGTYHELSRWLSRSIRQWQSFSEGMHTSLECGEEIPFNSREAVRVQSAGVEPRLRRFFDSQATGLRAICDAWDVNQASSIENEPVASEVPTLVLAGDYDPVTPPAWGQLAAETLSNSFYVEFPGVGHGVYSARTCAREIVDAFLEVPTTPPDTGCVAELRVGFITR